MSLCRRDDEHIPLTVLLAPGDETLVGHDQRVHLDPGQTEQHNPYFFLMIVKIVHGFGVFIIGLIEVAVGLSGIPDSRRLS